MADQGDPFTEDGESSEENNHTDSEMKKSVSLKELQVCVTDINVVQPSVTNRKRGRPKGSFKKPKYNTETSSENEAVQSTPKRGPGRPKKGPPKRGRPKKIIREGVKKPEPAADGTQPSHKRPGRPKGSRNKPVVIVRVENTSGRPTRPHVPPDKLNISLPRTYPGKGRGRPKKSNRGRPRKRPLPPGEELYQPRVWKALGRPRKYPKEERPETAPAVDTPRRGRGRPRKAESKKGAHLRKLDSDGLPRKVGRPPKAAKEQDGPPRKRGRPKGSFKNKTYNDNNTSVKMPHDSDHSPASEPQEDNTE